ncbi:MAG: ABC transporter ATP-binding protein [Solirubrobacteraceae bacterium]
MRIRSRGSGQRAAVDAVSRRDGSGGRAGTEVLVEHAVKRFGRINAVRGVSLRVSSGEALVITGPSGSGKSTLLALIGGLEQPDSGRVLIDGRHLWGEPHTAQMRREVVGFVFQRHLLLETLTARANVEVPLVGARMPRAERKARALQLLDAVGLSGRAEHVPAQLSGGERQRVAVARAIANQPRLLLADEPTGALDSATSGRVLDLLFDLREELGMTMVVVSYDSAMGERADRTVTLVDGAIQPSQERAPVDSDPQAGGARQ